MIIGFVIKDFNGQEQAAIDFIRTVCILENPRIADNIVAAGAGLNIFSESVTQEMLDKQPFDAELIIKQDGEYIIVSIVNFPVELSYLGENIRLLPTEFLRISPLYVDQFDFYIDKGLVRQIPRRRNIVINWILAGGIWKDTGVWLDEAVWED